MTAKHFHVLYHLCSARGMRMPSAPLCKAFARFETFSAFRPSNMYAALMSTKQCAKRNYVYVYVYRGMFAKDVQGARFLKPLQERTMGDSRAPQQPHHWHEPSQPCSFEAAGFPLH